MDRRFSISSMKRTGDLTFAFCQSLPCASPPLPTYMQNKLQLHLKTTSKRYASVAMLLYPLRCITLLKTSLSSCRRKPATQCELPYPAVPLHTPTAPTLSPCLRPWHAAEPSRQHRWQPHLSVVAGRTERLLQQEPGLSKARWKPLVRRDVCTLHAFNVCKCTPFQNTARIVNAEYPLGTPTHLFHLQDQICNMYTFNLTALKQLTLAHPVHN